MIDFKKVKTYPIAQRKNLVSIRDFACLEDDVEVLENRNLGILAERIVEAFSNDNQIIWMMGAHVIKVGMSPYIQDLMKKGIIKHLAFTGAGAIHDFEIAMIGETSEDVAENIVDGSFGMAEETGRYINEAIKQGAQENWGYGESIAKKIVSSNLPYKSYSLFAAALELNVNISVHVAIGTDIVHQHPLCDGAATGKCSYQDFLSFIEAVESLEKGVLVNIGSAVILPEVFLKALTMARNMGYFISDITTANLDMIDHYRPRVNVVQRPTAEGGLGLGIIGRHEKTIPSLYKLISQKL